MEKAFIVKTRSNDEWIAALSQDGTDAQAELFIELGTYLHRIVCGYIGRRGLSLTGLASLSNVEQAELAYEFVQETLIQIYARLTDYRGEGAFLSWTTTIAIRKAGEELRRAHWQTERYDPTMPMPATSGIGAPQSLPSLPDLSQRPDTQALTAEMWREIAQSVEDDLSEQQRRAFLARFVDDRTNHEIAVAEGVTPSVIYQRIHQARLKIKRRLEAAGYDSEGIG